MEPLTSFDGAAISDVDGPASDGVADDARDRRRFTGSGDDADDSEYRYVTRQIRTTLSTTFRFAYMH